MFLSIIIPTFNCEKYVKSRVESCLNQTFKGEYEIICVDDGSIDNTVAVLKEIASKNKNVTVIRNKHFGVSHARNCGIAKSCGGGSIFGLLTQTI